MRLSAVQREAVLSSARRGEPERYLAALLAPSRHQWPLLALAAVMAEIAAIPAHVREPMLGDIRLQWWRDALAGAAVGTRSGNPVADALGETIASGEIALVPLQRLVDARAFDLGGELHADTEAMEAYFAATEGEAFALAAGLLSGSPLPAPVSRAAGIAFGLARALVRLPWLLHHGGFPIPSNLLAAEGIAAEQLTLEQLPHDVAAAVDRLAPVLEARARQALDDVRAAWPGLPRSARIGLLPLASVEPYLAAQRRDGFRRLEQIAEIAPFARIWRTVSLRVTGRL